MNQDLRTPIAAFILFLLLVSCEDQIRLRTSKATIKIDNFCFAIGFLSDSIDVYMRFNDQNDQALVDANIIKRIAREDEILEVRARLKDSDKWKIVKVTDLSGSPVCETINCIDSMPVKCINIDSFPDFLPVDSMQIVKITCQCQI
jgi:hypothetical protein